MFDLQSNDFPLEILCEWFLAPGLGVFWPPGRGSGNKSGIPDDAFWVLVLSIYGGCCRYGSLSGSGLAWVLRYRTSYGTAAPQSRAQRFARRPMVKVRPMGLWML